MTENQREAPFRVRLIAGLRPVLLLSAELASLAGGAGFLIGIGLNMLIFARWNLAFLQVASPSDVLMSGLQIGAWLAILALAVGSGFWLADRAHPIAGKRLGWVYVISFAALMGAFMVVENTQVARSVSAVFMLFAASTFMAILSRLSRFAGLARWTGIVFVSMLILVQFYAYVNEVTDRGMVSSPSTAFLVGTTERTCSKAKVLWLGERSVVVRCADLRVAVLYDPGATVLAPVKEKYAVQPFFR